MNEHIWNEDDAQAMKEEKIERVKHGEDESIFQLTLQKCHGGCDSFLTQEEYDLFEVHCWDCKGGDHTGGGWSG